MPGLLVGLYSGFSSAAYRRPVLDQRASPNGSADSARRRQPREQQLFSASPIYAYTGVVADPVIENVGTSASEAVLAGDRGILNGQHLI